MALKGVDLDIGENEFVALVGTSGCGKSTLLSIAAGLETQSEGTIRMDGADIEAPGLDRGVVFQSYTLAALAHRARQCRICSQGRRANRPARPRDIARDHMHLVGLDGFEKAYPANCRAA